MPPLTFDIVDILIKAAQLILALVILVTVHEFGHYIFARIFGVKVNRFFLFFNPWFSILRYDPMKGTLEFIAPGTTRRRLLASSPWPPGRSEDPSATSRRQTNVARHPSTALAGCPALSGYCAIAGMVDGNTGQLSKRLRASIVGTAQQTGVAWQRLCVIMVAGRVLNFVLAMYICGNSRALGRRRGSLSVQ